MNRLLGRCNPNRSSSTASWEWPWESRSAGAELPITVRAVRGLDSMSANLSSAGMLAVAPRRARKLPAPDFVIAGAPKCGTTALYQYLQMHPRLFLCDPKEPHYFADDLLAHRTIVNHSDYLSLFEHADREQLVGEASA